MRLAANPADIIAPHNHRTAIAVVFLIAIVAVSSLAGTYVLILSRQSSTTSGGSPSQNLPVSAQLSVSVYDGSIVKASVTQNDDMVMNNFMNFLASWLTYEGTNSAPSTFTMTDTTGTVDTLVGRDSSTTSTVCSWACVVSAQPYAGGYIAVGTGATAVARTDHKLTTQYQSLVAVSAPPTYDPSTGNIVFGVGIIAGTAASISEVGFFENWFIASTTFANFLMFHDTFAAVPVSPGNTISIQYTVQLGSTAYNNNLGVLLAAILANSLGTASSVKLNPTSGTAQSVQVYILAPFNGNYYDPVSAPRADLGSGATGADSAIRVGTGSASTCPSNSAAGFAQSRSATDLCNPVLQYQPVNSYAFSPYVAVTAVIPSPTANSFTEAGYYLSFGSATYSFLLIRNTFGALAVPADSSITATYELSMS